MFTFLGGAGLTGGSVVLFEGFPLILSLFRPRVVLGAFSPSLLWFRVNIGGIMLTFSEGVGLIGCLLVRFEGAPPIFSLFWVREILGQILCNFWGLLALFWGPGGVVFLLHSFH